MWQLAVLVALFIALVAAGLLFVNQSLYKDFDGKDPVAQVSCGRAVWCTVDTSLVLRTVRLSCMLQALFAVVFALSANLLLLILSEILGVLSHRLVSCLLSCLCSTDMMWTSADAVVLNFDQDKVDHLERGRNKPPGNHSCSFAVLSMLQTAGAQP